MTKEEILRNNIDTLGEGQEFWVLNAMDEYATMEIVDFNVWVKSYKNTRLLSTVRLYDIYKKQKQNNE